MRTRTGLTAAALRHSEFYGIVLQAIGEDSPFPDEDIEQSILDAESLYARELGIRFWHTRIACAARARGLAADTYEEEEAAYSFPPDFFSGEQWGFMKLRQRPIVSVERVAFAFPTPASIIFELQPEWLRVDHKNGCFNIIPASGPIIMLEYRSSMLGIIGGAFTLPQSIVVDYTIGFTPDELRMSRYADVLRGIRMRAAIGLLPGLGIALMGGRTSRSLGLDGMSESGGWAGGKFGPYSGIVEAFMAEEKALRESLLQSLQGIRMVVL